MGILDIFEAILQPPPHSAEVVVVNLAPAVDHHVAYACHRSSHCPNPVPAVLAM